MSYLDTIRRLGNDAEQLEINYQHAIRSGQAEDFAGAIETSYAEASDNLLYAAWHYRLAHVATRARDRVIAWAWALPLGLVNGLLQWLIRRHDRRNSSYRRISR